MAGDVMAGSARGVDGRDLGVAARLGGLAGGDAPDPQDEIPACWFRHQDIVEKLVGSSGC